MLLKQRIFAISVSLILLAIVVALDYVTGYKVSLAVLYYVPIAYAAWYLGWAGGIGISLLGVCTMGWAELATGLHYSSDWILAEKSLVRLIAFLFVAFSFDFFHRTNVRNQKRIDQLEGMITFCTCCHKLQDSNGNWTDLDQFSRDHPDSSRVKLCPTCARTEYSLKAERRA